MAERKKFRVTVCGECVCCCGEPGKEECRLNPPTMITQYTAVYPKVRPGQPGCFQGVTKPLPTTKG